VINNEPNLELKPWAIETNEWDQGVQAVNETLFTLGNGWFGIRGAPEEALQDGVFYPGCYINGAYNRIKSDINGKITNYEQLVNWPNWLYLSCKIENGEWFDVSHILKEGYKQTLHLDRGYLQREFIICDSFNRYTKIMSRRVAHMAFPHLGYIEWELEPINWSGLISIRSAIDGSIVNYGIDRYRSLQGKNYNVRDQGKSENGIYLVAQTTQSLLTLFIVVKNLIVNHECMSRKIVTSEKGNYIAEDITICIQKSKKVNFQKIAHLFTSSEAEVEFTLNKVMLLSSDLPSSKHIFETQQQAWDLLWSKCDIRIDDEKAQCILRVHIFHLLQTYSLNSIEIDCGIPGRGIHGEGYLGHIFWDDLFIQSFFNFRIPELTKSLLLYRYRRLSDAQSFARHIRCQGALYPWRSGKSGLENTPNFHYNPISGHWIPDNTQLQYHINLSIAYNIWNYFIVSEDYSFLYMYGARMFLEISKFWSSYTLYDKSIDKFVIRNVVGPDEFHTTYVNSSVPGINNNAYTNIMVVWLLHHAVELLEMLPENNKKWLLAELKIDEKELERWTRIASKMVIFFHDESIISQFEHYNELIELNWGEYRQRYIDISRIDNILESEGDDVNKYKVAKQADVLMLFYLLTLDELKKIFSGLGYTFDASMLLKNIEYYSERTTYGSTLSHVVMSWVRSRANRSKSWMHFQHTLQSDVGNMQGSTGEGIHVGAMGGSLDLIQRCYGGLLIEGKNLSVNPRLPEKINEISMNLVFRNKKIQYTATKNYVLLHFEKSTENKVSENLVLYNNLLPIKPGEDIVMNVKIIKDEN
jgi:trehalose/maltose hydrolase-like predicted phosphorylase